MFLISFSWNILKFPSLYIFPSVHCCPLYIQGGDNLSPGETKERCLLLNGAINLRRDSDLVKFKFPATEVTEPAASYLSRVLTVFHWYRKSVCPSWTWRSFILTLAKSRKLISHLLRVQLKWYSYWYYGHYTLPWLILTNSVLGSVCFRPNCVFIWER
jgi:hypothetical protein